MRLVFSEIYPGVRVFRIIASREDAVDAGRGVCILQGAF
jgi:hypothetical protein